MVLAPLARGSRSYLTVSSLFARRKSVFRFWFLHPSARGADGARSARTRIALEPDGVVTPRETEQRVSLIASPSVARDPAWGRWVMKTDNSFSGWRRPTSVDAEESKEAAARVRTCSPASSGTELKATTTEPSSRRTRIAVTSSYRLGSPVIPVAHARGDAHPAVPVDGVVGDVDPDRPRWRRCRRSCPRASRTVATESSSRSLLSASRSLTEARQVMAVQPECWSVRWVDRGLGDEDDVQHPRHLVGAAEHLVRATEAGPS